jgi:hypothetical protein
MLRLLVLALVLANGVYFAWSQGLLRELGFAPVNQSEPQRLAQQLRPESLRVLKPEEVRRLDAAPPTPTPASPVNPPECLQAGLFDASQADALRGKLSASLPLGAWQIEPVVEPARWIVYMGKYPTAQALAKKRSELASLNLKFEPLTNPSLEFGVSLGLHQTQAAANTALANLNRRGVRTARVVQERAEVRGSLLKIPAADDAVKARLEEFKTALAGKPLRPCR